MTAALACLLMFPVPGLLTADGQKQLAKLQGKWYAETLVKEGVEMAFKPERTPYAVEVKGTAWNMIGDPGRYVIVGLDVRSEPMQINLKCLAPKPHVGEVQEAIFALSAEGKTLTLALPLSDTLVRPTGFDAPKESGRLLLILKRAEK